MPNRLIHETSPYLLQHVHNPVDWYPWNDEAIRAARTLDRPIFLSIGYSACHWCHVMEHESFENSEIAELMNGWFINVKVDREERPDLDHIYMSAVQTMTGSGGWPMSVFLTPDLKPFYGGTYWPPSARWGRPGFQDILAGVHDAWENRRETVFAQADELTDHLLEIATPSVGSSTVNEGLLRNAMMTLLRSADRVYGGFGDAPKFPHAMDIRVALRCWKRFSHEEILSVAIVTLEKMARGGIYDHLGGGFARYSTDERWLVPHFEKMLYDNALLVPAYLEAFQITGRTDFESTVRETLNYVLREMTSAESEGGFYSSQDADSEGVEGKFFVWSRKEIELLLVPENVSLFCDFYDVTDKGNWEHSNILNRPNSLEQIAIRHQTTVEELEYRLQSCRETLLKHRSQRIWPGRDEKVLVGWNGLMISAMSMGASVLREPRYAKAAGCAADFILRKMRTPEGKLLHCYKDGHARLNAYLDDYAALIEGLCDLYQAVFDPTYLVEAQKLADTMIELFRDERRGGFFYTSADHETLIVRTKDTYDGATPSGNSLAITALFKLSRLTGRSDFQQLAVETLESMSGLLDRAPMATAQALMGLDFHLGPTYEFVFVPGASDTSGTSIHNSCDRLFKKFVPNKVLVAPTPENLASGATHAATSLLEGKSSHSSMPKLYVCQQATCQTPLIGDAQISRAIENF